MKNWFRIFKSIIIVVVISVIIFSFLAFDYSENINKGIAENLIRLHVIANSDSVEDQALKLKVRDTITSYMKEVLQSSKTANESKRLIIDNMSVIMKKTSEVVSAEGMNYAVNASLGNFPFPLKKYGDIFLPAGNYNALKVVLGKGKGTNWWCVLFPPLCFVDASHGTVPDSVKEDLKKVLSEEEYRIISETDKESEIPIKIRFRVVDFFQESKIKFNGMISRIFHRSGK